ncbi:MAG: HlyD family efflux transporter periplasmic adaptor subunit [Pirellulaceae bacterium]|nr:HlyD family efflux transporter periplasmic adaptor subunit [Planctomycetales bacterium]
MKKRYWSIALLLIVAVFIWIWMAPRGVPVDVAVARRGVIREYVEERAKTRLPDIYEITMPLNGRILPITLREGDRVTSGEVVARMDTEELEEDLLRIGKQVEVAQRTLDNHDRSLEQSEQTMIASKARMDNSESQSARMTRLAQQNARSESERDNAEVKLVEDRVEYRKDVLEDAKLRTNRGNAELNYEELVSRKREAQSRLDKATIRSPVDGIVLQRQTANERWLPAGTLLLQVGSLDELEVEAEILTQDVVRINVGDTVDIEGPAIGPHPVAGRVTRIYPQGFTKRSSLGVEQQRVLVVVAFAKDVLNQLGREGRELGADFRVRVRIYTESKEATIVVPRAAVFRSASGEWQSYVVHDKILELRDIVVGLQNDFDVEIVSGIREGEQLVVAPEASLRKGNRVTARPLPQEGQAAP